VKSQYTYVVIRYVHDRAAGESLNVGVLLYSAAARYVAVQVEPRFERLSRAFAGFDGDSYRSTLHRLSEAVRAMRTTLNSGTLVFDEPLRDATEVLKDIWPDAGLGFHAGAMMSGVTSDPLPRVLSELFARMVSSQIPGRADAERRSDEEVWAGVYQTAMRRERISHHLTPRTFEAPEFEIRFDHTFQNKLWHVVQPVTMDFVRADSLQEKATRWLGNATALKGHPRLGKLYVLLGEPRLEVHRSAYDKAKNLLHKMPVKHEIVEEREADSFARELADYMRQHGIISDE
jgi:hypothetical protein